MNPSSDELVLIERARNGATYSADGAEISGDVLGSLLTGVGADQWTVTAFGVRLVDARIKGPLTLEGHELRCPLHFTRCIFDDRVILTDAQASAISLIDCQLRGLAASNLSVDQSLKLVPNSQSSGEINLIGATIGGILGCRGGQFVNASGIALNLQDARVAGTVFLDHGFTALGAVRVVGATIGGILACRGAHFVNASGIALNLQDARVAGTVFLDQGFTAVGAVRLVGARIDGRLVADEAEFAYEDAEAFALDALNVRVGGDVRIGGNPHSTRDPRPRPTSVVGGVRLARALIGGRLRCSGAVLRRPGKVALDAENVEVKGAAHFDHQFEVDGELVMVGAQFSGQLEFTGAHLRSSNGLALNGDNMRVGGDLLMNQGFASDGELRLRNVHVAGTVECSNSTFKFAGAPAQTSANTSVDPSRVAALNLSGARIAGELVCTGSTVSRQYGQLAVNANGIVVGQSVLFNRKFRAIGQVDLIGADIEGQLNCKEGTFENGAAQALLAFHAKIGADLFFVDAIVAGGLALEDVVVGGRFNCDGGKFIRWGGRALDATSMSVSGEASLENCIAIGEVKFRRASLASRLRCGKSAFAQLGGKSSFDGIGMAVTGMFQWKQLSVNGDVKLRDARIGLLSDDLQSWPDEHIDLRGFTYGALEEPGLSLADRKVWLGRQRCGNGGFSTQPYQHLAEVYRDSGRRSEARSIGVAKEKARRHRSSMGVGSKFWHWVKGITVDYGYRPWKAVRAVFVIIAIGFALFSWADSHHGIHPTKPTASADVAAAEACKSSYPCFYPEVYAVDVAVPVVNLQQRDYWSPAAHTSFGWLYRGYFWFATGAGWFLTTLVIAGVTGVLNRD